MANGIGVTAQAAPTTARASRHLRPVKSIKQDQLKEYLDLVMEKAALKARLAELEPDLEAYSVMLCEYTKQGIPVEKGPLMGRVKVVAGRRVPKYKEWIVANHGEETVEQILAETPKTDDKETFEVMKRLGV